MLTKQQYNHIMKAIGEIDSPGFQEALLKKNNLTHYCMKLAYEASNNKDFSTIESIAQYVNQGRFDRAIVILSSLV